MVRKKGENRGETVEEKRSPRFEIGFIALMNTMKLEVCWVRDGPESPGLS